MLDHPPANIAAMLAKPTVEVILTDTTGKALNVQISKESGDLLTRERAEALRCTS